MIQTKKKQQPATKAPASSSRNPGAPEIPSELSTIPRATPFASAYNACKLESRRGEVDTPRTRSRLFSSKIEETQAHTDRQSPLCSPPVRAGLSPPGESARAPDQLFPSPPRDPCISIPRASRREELFFSFSRMITRDFLRICSRLGLAAARAVVSLRLEGSRQRWALFVVRGPLRRAWTPVHWFSELSREEGTRSRSGSDCLYDSAWICSFFTRPLGRRSWVWEIWTVGGWSDRHIWLIMWGRGNTLDCPNERFLWWRV